MNMRKDVRSKKYVSIPKVNSNYYNENTGQLFSEKKRENGQDIYTSIRRKIMRDDEFKYVYSMHGDCVHDKNCYLVKKINDHEFKYLRNYPLWLKQCPKCAANAYIRNGALDFEKINYYREFFRLTGANDDMLRHIYIECGMKTRIYKNTLKVYYNEDTWKIMYLDIPGRVRLYHNNYHIENNKRVFEKSFHIQSDFTSNTTAKYAFENIETYSWDMHRVNIDNTEKQSNVLSEKEKKKSKIRQFFGSLFGNKDTDKYTNENADDAKSVNFELFFSDFNLVKECGYPEDGMRCIYIWKTKNDIYQWQLGEYNARKRRFIIKFDEQAFVTDRNKVVAWKYVWKGKLSEVDGEKES